MKHFFKLLKVLIVIISISFFSCQKKSKEEKKVYLYNNSLFSKDTLYVHFCSGFDNDSLFIKIDH